MTREEAISCLNMIEFINGECTLRTWWRGIDDEMRSAIEMAIKALEQEPIYYPPCEDCHKKMDAIRSAYDKLQQPCDDAISRKAVIEITAETGALETQGRVKALPSVTPKQKTGRWIIDREIVDKSKKPTTYYFETRCSECGLEHAYTTDIEDRIPIIYCPNCGARMEEGSSEE